MRRTIQGTARYCSLCKNAGIPEKKFKSHHNDSCQDRKEILNKAVSGGMASRNDGQKAWKKENKILSKKILKTEKKLKRLSKLKKK